MARLPLPPGFSPREPGESRYSYENRLSVARYGRTIYQRRVERGLTRGLTIAEARGHAPPQQITERAYKNTSVVGPQFWQNQQYAMYYDAAIHGYTEATTGLTKDQLNEVWPLISQMNQWASPDGQLTPYLILDAVEAEEEGRLDDGWTYYNIKDKYRAMYDYHVARIRAPRDVRVSSKKYKQGSYMPDNRFGRMRFMRGRNNYQVPIMWWWYH